MTNCHQQQQPLLIRPIQNYPQWNGGAFHRYLPLGLVARMGDWEQLCEGGLKCGLLRAVWQLEL